MLHTCVSGLVQTLGFHFIVSIPYTHRSAFLLQAPCSKGMVYIDRQGFHSRAVSGLVSTDGFTAPHTRFSTELGVGSALIGTELRFVTLILCVNSFRL
jgi:hypothetical protein